MKVFRYLAGVALVFALSAADVSASLRYFDTDRLNEGQSHTITLKFAKNSSYMVVTAASQGSVDFDITVIDPDGDEVIKSDSTDENTDWVRFTASQAGDYKIKVNAYKGSGWYELMVLATDGY